MYFISLPVGIALLYWASKGDDREGVGSIGLFLVFLPFFILCIGKG